MPHDSTWSRVLGQGRDPSEVEQIIGRIFAQASQPAEYQRGSRHVALDGKPWRGTIPLGETEEVHRLSMSLLADPHRLLALTPGLGEWTMGCTGGVM
jgi:hypothetical protein